MLKRTNLVCTYLSVLLTLSCSQSEETPTDAPASELIAFGVDTGKDGRAATLIGADSEEAFRAKPFAVFGDWKDTQNGTPLEEVFDNVVVSYDGKAPAPSGWNYEEPKRWKTNGYYDFRAYWPATNPIENTSNAQTLALEYNMQIHNEDLMVAYKGCPTKSGEVGLAFRHALTAVAVKFVTESTTHTYVVKNFFFSNLYYTGTLPYSDKNETADLTTVWQFAERSQESVRLREWTSGEGRIVPNQAEGWPEEYDLFLPQPMGVAEGTPKPSLTFEVEIKQGDTKIDTATFTVSLPDKDKDGNVWIWEAGKKYIYEVKVKPEVFEITVNTTEWDEVNVSVGDIYF